MMTFCAILRTCWATFANRLFCAICLVHQAFFKHFCFCQRNQVEAKHRFGFPVTAIIHWLAETIFVILCHVYETTHAFHARWRANFTL
jgi:hypothetical protein